MNVPRQSPRSISPISPSRSEGHRAGLLSAMVKRFHGRKSSQESRLDFQPEDDSGCSTDSCSSAGANLSSSNYSSILSNLTATSQDDTSSNCSAEERPKSLKHSKMSVHFRSTSSLRRALRSLSISTRSLSCTSGSDRRRYEDEEEEDVDEACEAHFEYEKRVSFKTVPAETQSHQSVKISKRASNLIAQRSKTPPPQRRILRQPVSYYYIKGMSGLPTQRVPRSSVCCPQGYR